MAVTQHWVWTCDSGTRSQAASLGDASGTNHPTCTSGQGAWTQLTYDDGAAFDPTTVNSTTVATAIGAGFISMAVPLVMVIAGRLLVHAIWKGDE